MQVRPGAVRIVDFEHFALEALIQNDISEFESSHPRQAVGLKLRALSAARQGTAKATGARCRPPVRAVVGARGPRGSQTRFYDATGRNIGTSVPLSDGTMRSTTRGAAASARLRRAAARQPFIPVRQSDRDGGRTSPQAISSACHEAPNVATRCRVPAARQKANRGGRSAIHPARVFRDRVAPRTRRYPSADGALAPMQLSWGRSARRSDARSGEFLWRRRA